MDFDPITSLFGSPPRDGRRGHNQTYTTPPSNQKLSNKDEEIPLQSAKTQSSSVRITRGINLNLLSRISKFEALDALSMPIKLPSLRPAHLQIYRNSVSLKGTETSHRKRLLTIFSPSSETRDEYTQIEDDLASEQDTLASAKSRKWFSSKTVDSRKLRRSEASYKPANIRMRGGVRDTTEASESTGIDITAIANVQNEVPARKKSMKDMIKLYDGSSDKVVSNAPSKGKKTEPPPSVLAKTQVTPRTGKKDIKPSPGDSTASSRRKLITEQKIAPTTPTKTYQSFAAKQRQPVNGPHTPASTINSKPSPSKSSISNVSQGTLIRTKASNHGMRAKSEKSPVHVSPKRGTVGRIKPQAPSSGTKQKPSAAEEKGRTLVRPDDKENPTAKLSLDQRKISGKIVELYRAKSLERNHDSLREFGRSQDAPSARARTLPRADITRQTAFEDERGRTRSRVADIRMKFEGAAAPKPPIPVVPPSLPMPLFSNISPFSNDRKAKSEMPAPPPPIPVFLPPNESKRSANVSPKTVQEVRTVDARKRTRPNDSDIPAPLATTQKQSTKSTGTIRDRIKLFESIQQTKKHECEKSKSRYARRIRTSMKSLFESRKSDKDDGRGLSSQEVQSIIDEFQDTEALLPKTGKRGTLIGRWTTFQEVPPSNTTDGTMSEKGGSPCAEGVTVMIVKEVECGLKQPKPVRITEMKRMMLLCRERVGSIIDKEKGRVVLQSRKL